jgi:hypothetical protein
VDELSKRRTIAEPVTQPVFQAVDFGTGKWTAKLSIGTFTLHIAIHSRHPDASDLLLAVF